MSSVRSAADRGGLQGPDFEHPEGDGDRTEEAECGQVHPAHKRGHRYHGQSRNPSPDDRGSQTAEPGNETEDALQRRLLVSNRKDIQSTHVHTGTSA